MTRVCRACDKVIVPPQAAVLVAHQESNSGPGWDIWAHADHVDDVELIDPVLLRIMTRIWAARAGSGGSA
ncbi:hypothetical protein AB0F77_17065 [Streptomyces sp. NPDC026672]|uniref:hypothetical protein n=1 Tax=unclassified Streptomyces TaxID=2593676 RepID=UPI0033E40517